MRKLPVIARIPNDEVDRETKQSARIGLQQVSLNVQIASPDKKHRYRNDSFLAFWISLPGEVIYPTCSLAGFAPPAFPQLRTN
jgi:hypothetical protein